MIRSPAVAARCREVAGRMSQGDPAGEACRLIESLAGRDGDQLESAAAVAGRPGI